MKVLLDKENVVFDLGEDIVFAKGGAEDGGLQECPKEEATHIWNREKNTACMNDGDVTLIEVEEVPEEVKENEYKYVNGAFVVNENYIPYIPPEERIAALEDMVNMLLLGGNE